MGLRFHNCFPFQGCSNSWRARNLQTHHADSHTSRAQAFPSVPGVKNPLANAGDTRDSASIPGSGRSLGREDPWVEKIPGGGNGNPLECSCLENPWTEEAGGLQPTGFQRVGQLSTRSSVHWKKDTLSDHQILGRNGLCRAHTFMDFFSCFASNTAGGVTRATMRPLKWPERSPFKSSFSS